MLVLSRKIGEEVVIEGDIRVRVIAIKGGIVRIGIDAPPDVRIDRAEIDAARNEFQTRQERILEAVIH